MCFDDFDNEYEEELFDEQGEESWQDDNVFDLNEHDAASREVEFFEKNMSPGTWKRCLSWGR